ncbi:hypothetical protein NL676_022163 [Syzygium grande]|nr:hypothetical protein NL676_022163 [Syzygium grande]
MPRFTLGVIYTLLPTVRPHARARGPRAQRRGAVSVTPPLPSRPRLAPRDDVAAPGGGRRGGRAWAGAQPMGAPRWGVGACVEVGGKNGMDNDLGSGEGSGVGGMTWERAGWWGIDGGEGGGGANRRARKVRTWEKDGGRGFGGGRRRAFFFLGSICRKIFSF